MVIDKEQAFCVIGSGPSGVACALALLERNHKVVMLDVGIKPSEDAFDLAQRSYLNPTDYRNWQHVPPRLGDVPLKLKFGSAFAYHKYAASAQALCD